MSGKAVNQGVMPVFKNSSQALLACSTCITTVSTAEIMNYISSGTVEDTLYYVSDMEYGGAYFQGAAPNLVSPQGWANVLVPNYTVTGIHKGQLLPTSTVNSGELWIWGNTIWLNTTGSNPPAVDDNTLAGPDWIQATPDFTFDNLQTMTIGVDWATGIVTSYKQITSQNQFERASTLAGFGIPFVRQYSGTGNIILESSGIISNNQIKSIFGITLCQHIGFGTNTDGFRYNVIEGQSAITQCKARNSRVNSNILTATVGGQGTFPQIGWLDLSDDFDMVGNQISGDGACIWDVHALENCQMMNNVLSGDETALVRQCRINAIYMSQGDSINSNTLSASGAWIDSIQMLGLSTLSNNTIDEEMAEIARGTLREASLTGFTYTNGSGKTGIRNVVAYNTSLSNGTDINLNDCFFENVIIDFSGWTRDVEGLSIRNGIGSFMYTHDFSSSPLTSGSAVFANIFPTGSRIVNMKAVGISLGGGAGAELELGMESDDPSLIGPSTLTTYNSGSLDYTLSSNPATQHRSLRIAASVANVTSGSLKIIVQFIL